VLSLVGDFLVFFHFRLAAGNTAESCDVKLAMVVLPFELDQDVIGCGGSIGHIKVKHRPGIAETALPPDPVFFDAGF